ncbi:flagellar basal body rod protein FlgB [Paenibacillus nasutitermitis]|uniref:Flagellar basal body rod protein FlgB n=1 Tax=Paenibacillus nasutitermitis TaxID=1652958 RepID=A0A917DTV8_9BACL|nr:flagellar basal body rod protein FlgB [Paenibacillus nasutitermitis]GGD68450.1 flagellar basal body rod protein FlgB [Paenibacillus nasutitermitis]
MLLNSPGFHRLQGAISAAEMRQRVISNNVANDDTPKFKRSDVTFEQLLDQTLSNGMPVLAGKRTDTRHIPIGASSSLPEAKIVTDEHSVMNNNSNNVDIDREMSLLAENQLSYNFYIQQLNHDVKMMRTAIEGR